MLARQQARAAGADACSSAAVTAGWATMDLLSDRLSQLGNATLGAARISLHGLEGQALLLLKVRAF